MRITRGHVVPGARPAELTPPAVAREFRALLAGGAALRPAGEARRDPTALTAPRYTPRHRIALFDTTYYLGAPRQNPAIRFFVAYVVQGRAVYPRIFYKDVSLVWRSASHYAIDDGATWIGKGDLRAVTCGGEEYLVSAEETTNLPLEIQCALETVLVQATRIPTDNRAVALVLRRGAAHRIAPFRDFTGPRERAAAGPRNRVNGGRRVARFARRGDPTSLVFAPGFAPDFAHGVLETGTLRSRLYGGTVERWRVLAHNAQVQYLLFAGPRHAWVGDCQATTAHLTSYGVRSIDAVVDEELLMPGYEYHLADEDGRVPEETRQIPAGFEGAPSTEDPNRVDTSAWLDRVPVIRQFRRVLARAGVRGSGR